MGLREVSEVSVVAWGLRAGKELLPCAKCLRLSSGIRCNQSSKKMDRSEARARAE